MTRLEEFLLIISIGNTLLVLYLSWSLQGLWDIRKKSIKDKVDK